MVRSKEPAPPERTPERLGQTRIARPEGTLIWLHAKRTEDTGVAAALVAALGNLRDEPIHCLTTTLEAGAPVAGHEGAIIHQLVPGDTSGSVRRFLAHWSPDIGVILSAPDRPLLLTEARARDCPLILAAPRRGETSPTGRMGLLPASLVDVFDRCFAPSAAEAEALRKHVPADRVVVTGPLTDTAVALPCNQAECDAIADQLAGRPVWLAAGTEDADLHAVERAHRRATRAAHRLLLVISPNDAATGPKIAAWFENKGWRTATRSAGDEPTEDVQVYVADTSGEMGLWYRLSPVTYLGGTFTPGRQPLDPFGPASLGSAVIHGPERGPAPARFRKLAVAGASRQLEDPEALGEVIYTLLAPDKAAALAHTGWLVTTESAHVVETIAEYIDEALLRKQAG